MAPPPAAAAGTPLEVLPGFDVGAGTSWVYPVNYPLRQYQYNIVRKRHLREYARVATYGSVDDRAGEQSRPLGVIAE